MARHTLGPKPRVPDEDILALFDETRTLVTMEVANQLPLTRQAVRKRLYDLEEQGYLQKRKPGKKTLIWTRV